MNSQNFRIWSYENLHVFIETLLHLLKVRLWLVVSRRRLYAPIFINKPLLEKDTGKRFRNHSLINLINSSVWIFPAGWNHGTQSRCNINSFILSILSSCKKFRTASTFSCFDTAGFYNFWIFVRQLSNSQELQEEITP